MAEELDIEPVFRTTTRIRRVRRQARETARDVPMITSHYNKFVVKFFNCLLDTTLISMKDLNS